MAAPVVILSERVLCWILLHNLFDTCGFSKAVMCSLTHFLNMKRIDTCDRNGLPLYAHRWTQGREHESLQY